MHGEGGNGDEKAALRRFAAYGAVLPHRQPSRDFQGAVEKAVPDAAAVFFDVEPGIGAACGNRVFFQLERRGIGVRGDDLEGEAAEVAHRESDKRAAAPHDEIFSAFGQRPVLRFGEGDEAVFQKEVGGVFHRVIGGVGGVEKFDESVCHGKNPAFVFFAERDVFLRPYSVHALLYHIGGGLDNSLRKIFTRLFTKFVFFFHKKVVHYPKGKHLTISSSLRTGERQMKMR